MEHKQYTQNSEGDIVAMVSSPLGSCLVCSCRCLMPPWASAYGLEVRQTPSGAALYEARSLSL
jgi:hypothetical protein